MVNFKSSLSKLRKSLALKGNVPILFTESAVTAMCYGMFYVIWQPFVLGLGASMASLGILFAILSLLGSSSSLIWGKIADRIGRRPLLILSSMLRMTALIFCVIAKAWYLLIPFAILMGLSASYQQSNPVRASIVAESVEPEERGTAYSILMFSSIAVSAVAGPLGGFLAIAYGFTPIFYACIGADMCCSLLTALFVQETLGRASQAKLHLCRSWSATLSDMLKPEPHLKGLYISLIADAFAWGIGGSILYGMLVETYGFTPYQLGLLSTVLNLSWAASQIPIGKLTDRCGRKPFLLVSELIGIAMLSGLLFSRSFKSFAILHILWGIMAATWVPAMNALLADSVPKESRAEAIGRLQAYRGVFSFPAPYIGGLLYGVWGFQAPVLASLVGVIIAFTLIFSLVRKVM